MIKELTSLRFVLILLIFLHHISDSFYPGGGTLGVSFFFILGGFCTTLGYKDKVTRDDFSYGSYLKNRLIKFYPLHWLCLLIALAWALLMSQSITTKGLAVLGINAALLQSWIPLKGIYFSYNAVSWYLSNTVFFVFAFPVVAKLLMRKRSRYLFLLILLLTYSALCVFLPKDYVHAILYINPLVRLCDFIVGILAALLYTDIRKHKPYMFVNLAGKALGIIIFAGLIVMSLVINKDIQLMAWIYWIPCIILLIIIALGGGGQYFDSNLSLRSGTAVLLSFSYTNYASR